MSWKNLKDYYVYTYYGDNNLPYYVGMGQKRRVIANHKYVTVPEWAKISVIDNLTESNAHELEIKLIDQYGLKCNGSGILCNLQKGGKTQKSGWYHSDVAKKKISQGNKGKIRNDMHRENYSKPKSSEHIEKIKQANIGRPYDDRYLKISATKSKQRWYNNGQKSIMRVPGEEPKEFVPGRLNWRNS